MIGVNTDVTEHKLADEGRLEVNRTLEAQAALLQSREELLKIFVRNVPAAVAMLDRDMRAGSFARTAHALGVCDAPFHDHGDASLRVAQQICRDSCHRRSKG
jgi:hypothetical protein